MGGQGYTIKRNVSFSKEIIWEAWTDPDAFGTWFGGRTRNCTTRSGRCRPG